VEQRIGGSSRHEIGVRGECMAEERHYVEEEPAFILNRGICGRHAMIGRVIKCDRCDRL
jgi:hypothetical protein